MTEKSQAQSFTSGPGSPQQMIPQFQDKSSQKSILINYNLQKFANNESLQQFDAQNYLQSQEKLNYKQNFVNLPTQSIKILLANIKKEKIQLKKNNQLPAGKQVNWAQLSSQQQYQVLQQINICENLLANHEGIIQKAVNGFLQSQDQLSNLLLSDEDIQIFVSTIKQRALDDLKNIVDKVEGIPGYQFKDALNYLLLKNKIQNDLNQQRQVNLSFLPFMLSRESARVKFMKDGNGSSRSQQSRQNKQQRGWNEQVRGRSEINCSMSMAYYEQTIIDSLMQQIKQDKQQSSKTGQYIIHDNLPQSLQSKKKEVKEKKYQTKDLELNGCKIKTEEIKKEEVFSKNKNDLKNFSENIKNMSLPNFKKRVSNQNSNPTSSNMVSRDYTLNQENSNLGFQSGPNLFMYPSQDLANITNNFNKNTVIQISQSTQEEINKILQISSSKDLIAQQELEKYNKIQDEMKVQEPVGQKNPPEQFYEVTSYVNDDQFHNKTENTEHIHKEYLISENDIDENKQLINAVQGQEISYINLDKTNLQQRFIPNSALHIRSSEKSGSNQIIVMPNSISEESKTSQQSQYNDIVQKNNETQLIGNFQSDQTQENFRTKSINPNHNKSTSLEKTHQTTDEKSQKVFQAKRQSTVKPINVYMSGNQQQDKFKSLDQNGLLVSKYTFGNKKNFTVLNPIQCPILSKNQKVTLLLENKTNKNQQKNKKELMVEIVPTFTQENINTHQSKQFSQGSNMKTDEQFEIPQQNFDSFQTKTENKIYKQQIFKGLVGERQATASPDYKSRKQTDADRLESSSKDEGLVEIKKIIEYTQKKRSSVGNSKQISLYEGISVRSTDNQKRKGKKIMNNSDLNDFIQSGSDISSTQRVKDQNYTFSHRVKINDQSIISNRQKIQTVDKDFQKNIVADQIVQKDQNIQNYDKKFEGNSPIHAGQMRINTQNGESDDDKGLNKFITTPHIPYSATIKNPNKDVNLNLGEPTLYPDSLLEQSATMRKSSLDKQKIMLSARNQMELKEGDEVKVELDGNESFKQIHLPALIQRKRLTAAVKLPAQKQTALRAYKEIRNNKMQSCAIKQARQLKFEQQFQQAFQSTVRNNIDDTRNNFQIKLDNFAESKNSLTPNFNLLFNENKQRPSALAILNSTETNFKNQIIQHSEYSQDLSSEFGQETPWIIQFVAGGPPSLHYGGKPFTSHNHQGFMPRGSIPVTENLNKTHFQEKNSISTNKMFSQIQDNSNTTVSARQRNNKMRNFSVEYSDNSFKYTIPQILKGSAGIPVVPALKEILRAKENKMSQTATNKLFITHRQTEPFIANQTMAQTANHFIKIKK